MTKKTRQGYKAICPSVTPDLLAAIDARAAQLDLNRSKYLQLLVRADLLERGAIPIRALPNAPDNHALNDTPTPPSNSHR